MDVRCRAGGPGLHPQKHRHPRRREHLLPLHDPDEAGFCALHLLYQWPEGDGGDGHVHLGGNEGHRQPCPDPAAKAPLPGEACTRGGRDGRLVLSHPDLPDLAFDPLRDQAAVLDWLAPQWADSGKAPPARQVEGVQAQTEVSEPWLSVLSLS